MTEIVCRLRALRVRYSYLDWSEGLTEAADEIERLLAENRNLRDVLFDYYSQNKCGCGHPACKRCRDDRFVEDVLAAAPQPAEQQPNATQLVEALEKLVTDVERGIHVEFGGTPWLKEKMAEIDYARAALAAYRKGGEQ